jgi:DNA-directed RNA polymerase subunit omega
MARITVEDCLTQENNRFSLVQLASKRTKQILQGGTVQISDKRNKAVVTALREIAGGKVRFMTPEETAAWQETREREAEAQRAAELSERERRQQVGAALFINTNGGETRPEESPKDALMQTGPISAADEKDEE